MRLLLTILIFSAIFYSLDNCLVNYWGPFKTLNAINTSSDSAIEEQIEEMMIATMLKEVMPKKFSPFLPESSTAPYRKILLDEYAKTIQKQGGIGIAAQIKNNYKGNG